MSDALFEVEHPDPGRIMQECDDCECLAWASNDGLRVRGWLVFDGDAQGGQSLHIRVCPACQRKRIRAQRATAQRYQALAQRALQQPPLFESAQPPAAPPEAPRA